MGDDGKTQLAGTFNFPLKYKGIFDFDAIYYATLAWAKSQEMKVFQQKYKDKASVLDMREIGIQLLAATKLDEFVAWKVTVNIDAWDAKYIDVNGKRMMQGRIQIKISGFLQEDHQGGFTGSAMYERMGGIVRWLRAKDSKLFPETPCRNKMLALRDEYKQILGITTHVS